ncbi:MAG: hypothetical protein HY899_06030 [Deltaproteobacteria bacterium]|nr:hypothetical protein [Deltaproteobacteria bacterium]
MRRLGPCASCLLLAALVWTTAAASLHYQFVYDDVAVVVERQPFWEEGLGSFFTSRHWVTGRQATLASLDLDRLWNDPGALAFHRTNVVLATLVALLVWVLATRISLSPQGALVAAALFAVHPVHVDAVVAVVGRAELLAALGVLTALVLSIRAPARSTGSAARPLPESGAAKAGRCLLIFGAALVAVFAKESAACLALLLLASRWALGPRVRLAAPLAAAGAALALWVVVATPSLGVAMTPEFVDNPLAHAPALERIPKALALLGSYLRLTLWPHPLLLDRCYAQTDPSLISGYAAVIGWAAYCCVALALRRRSAAAALALVWFPIAFAFTANVVVPIGTIMAERLLFLPSLGPCLLAGVVVDEARNRGRLERTVATGLAAAIVAIYVPLFLERGAAWASAEVYFPASTAASPRSAKAWYDLGQWLSTRRSTPGSALEAEAAWRRALEILPDFHRANYELAESLGRRGQPLAGAEVYERFLKLVPDDTGALTNITRLLLEARQPERANAYAQRLISLEPDNEAARETLVLTESMMHKAQRGAPSVSP